MRKNDLLEIKALDQKALLGRVKKLRGELSDLIIDKNMNKLSDFKVISKRRKDLAQVLTTLRQKQILAQLSGDSGQETAEDKTKKEVTVTSKKGAK